MNPDLRRGVPFSVVAQALIESGADPQPKPSHFACLCCGWPTTDWRELIPHHKETHRPKQLTTYYTLSEVAAIKGMPRTTLGKRIKRGLMEASRDERTGQWLIDEGQIDAIPRWMNYRKSKY